MGDSGSRAGRQMVVGVVAHVDAGKTTLCEALLYEAGAVRERGRVDHGDAHLDLDPVERERGITVYSTLGSLDHAGAHLMLLDAPGHVDFSAEAERTMQVLDCAVLVVSAADGVQGHTETMWRLLERYAVPTFVFVNKTDLAGADVGGVLAELRERLSGQCLAWPADAGAGGVGGGADGDGGGGLRAPADPAFLEAAALGDEAALDELVATDGLAPETLSRLVAERKLFPCFAGSALHGAGVAAFLDALAAFAPRRAWPAEFAARVYKVSHTERGERLTWMKVTGGELRARQPVEGAGADGAPWAEKAEQLRLYSGASFRQVDAVGAGQVCAVLGLSRTRPGDALGAEPAGPRPVLAPVLSYRVALNGADVHAAFRALSELAEEDPALGVTWSDELQEIRVQLMGEVQLEVLQETCRRRFGLELGFEAGGILYRETIRGNAVVGIGHFEPLRHYAEVHVRLEPLPRGSGLEFGSVCSVDDLELHWQRLALGQAMKCPQLGVLTGSPLADVRVTLLSGRAHPKHTEGGDFRQAVNRAIRQGLMQAESVLLEPWYRFTLEVPQGKVGRALTDLQRMAAEFGAPQAAGGAGAGAAGLAVIEGAVPASEVRGYALQVAAYTSGEGSLSLEYAGYRECHDAGRVIAEAGYDPRSDVAHTPDSVFCSHGAGVNVPWDEVAAHAHVEDDPGRWRPYRRVAVM